MANVNPPPRERAQLILVSGLIIAVTLIVLVLLLNTTIYTENVATRGIGAEGGEAVNAKLSIEGDIESIVSKEESALEDNPGDDVADLKYRIETAADHTIQFVGDRARERGAIVEGDPEFTYGIDVERDDKEQVSTSATLAREVQHIESFSLDLSVTDTGSSDPTDSFEILLGDDWSAFVEADADGDVTVYDDQPTELCTISGADGSVTLNVTNEEMSADGSTVACEGLWDAGVDGPSELSVAPNEDEDAETAFAFVATGTTIEGGDDLDPEEWTPFVDETEIEFAYRSGSMEYRTTITIPGGAP